MDARPGSCGAIFCAAVRAADSTCGPKVPGADAATSGRATRHSEAGRPNRGARASSRFATGSPRSTASAALATTTAGTLRAPLSRSSSRSAASKSRNATLARALAARRATFLGSASNPSSASSTAAAQSPMSRRACTRVCLSKPGSSARDRRRSCTAGSCAAVVLGKAISMARAAAAASPTSNAACAATKGRSSARPTDGPSMTVAPIVGARRSAI